MRIDAVPKVEQVKHFEYLLCESFLAPEHLFDLFVVCLSRKGGTFSNSGGSENTWHPLEAEQAFKKPTICLKLKAPSGFRGTSVSASR